MASPRNRRAAFTLVELVFVLGVMVLFVFLLAPYIYGAPQARGRIGCQSNLRQLGMVMAAYADDHDGQFPLRAPASFPLNNQYPFADHARVLAAEGYLKDGKPYVCPNDEFDGFSNNIAVFPLDDVTAPAFNGFQNMGYLYIAGHHAGSPENPATAVILTDESNYIENGATTPGSMPPLQALDNHGADYRNVLYLDGHVEGVVGTDHVNDIFTFAYPASLQAVD